MPLAEADPALTLELRGSPGVGSVARDRYAFAGPVIRSPFMGIAARRSRSVGIARARGVLAALAAVYCGTTAAAHHSIVGIYDFTQRLTLDGIVGAFEFVNPHPFLTIETKQPGRAGRWRLEMDNRWELAELGFASQTLKPGDRIVVIVNPARAAERQGYVRRLDRPADGFKYQHHD